MVNMLPVTYCNQQVPILDKIYVTTAATETDLKVPLFTCPVLVSAVFVCRGVTYLSQFCP